MLMITRAVIFFTNFNFFKLLIFSFYDNFFVEAKQGCEANNLKDEENWDSDNIVYHTFNLPRDSIHIINDEKSFQDFLKNGLKNIDLVGIDSEWKPSFSKNQIEKFPITSHV